VSGDHNVISSSQLCFNTSTHLGVTTGDFRSWNE